MWHTMANKVQSANRPTLSVITPNYNHGKYIGQAIEAVVTQSRPPDEYIVLDDASTDNSVDIINSYACRYPFIRFVRNGRNCGVLANAVRLLEMASGNYVYCGAADDFIMPGFLEKAMSFADRFPQAGVVFGKIAVVSADGIETERIAQSSRWASPIFACPTVFLREYLEVEKPWHSLSAATVFRTQCLRDAGGFRPELDSWADTFAINAIALRYGACYVPEVFTCFRSLSTSFGAVQGRQVKTILDIVTRTARLMRSSEFRDVFPEDYVTKWVQAITDATIRSHLYRVCTDAQSNYIGRQIGCLKNRPLIRHFATALERVWFKFLVEREKWNLRSYTGRIAGKA
jgi:glycosyltransferase involved in cell wall biosynthesis